MSEIRELFRRYLGQTSPSPMMLEIVKAEGSFMYGRDGESYLDLISGVTVSNTGHRHPRVIAAIKEQLDSYLHLMVYGEMVQTPQVRYAEKIISILPDHLNSCYFVNSGSEAVEGALKLAKRYTGRSRIVFFGNSYHGSTHGAMSVQGSEHYKHAFRPLLPDVFQAGFNTEDYRQLVDGSTACVIAEPVQAEAGVVFPGKGFLHELKKRCEETGTLLIFDESQTGFGRTGSMFAFEKFGTAPDILVLSKALGGGLPLGAFISGYEIMNSLTLNPALGHITTFGGHPVCCAAGLASLEVIIEENLPAEAARKSTLIRRLLNHKLIREIRGEGLLLAIVTGDPAKTSFIVSHAPEYGIILDYFLFCNDAFRIAPPLTISDEEIEYGCRRLQELMDEAEKVKKK